MREPILVLNAGSSSLKFSVFETTADRSLAVAVHGQVESIGSAAARLTVADAKARMLADQPVAGGNHDAAIGAIQHWFAEHVRSHSGFDGVGHRIVHGGERYLQPLLIDDAVLAGLEQLVPLAPLHQPHQIAAVRAIRSLSSDVPQVACFDTAFHATQLPLVRQFALPREISAKGIRRYGFHGLSYEFIVSALPRVAPECVDSRIVVAHLGNGASMCAIHRGCSVATTMGFSALDGVPMGTRCGALDPGVMLYLMQHEQMTPRQIEQLLYERSGLLGVSGISSDMRTLLASTAKEAAEAVDLFVYRIGRELGSLVAALGGLDALIFTGGIGEHAHQIRARVCQQAAWLGVDLHTAANERGGPRISEQHSRVSAWVIPTDENLMVARHTRRLLDN